MYSRRFLLSKARDCKIDLYKSQNDVWIITQVSHMYAQPRAKLGKNKSKDLNKLCVEICEILKVL
jgi:hypothetical protein